MHQYRVLLADDHAVVRSGIRNAIENLPNLVVVGEAEDGPTLMNAIRSLSPDILLIDVTMPEFDPITAIRDIRSSYPEMMILVISAYDDDVYVQGLLGAGVNGYHLKDQPLHDLRLAIERIINGERWISSPLIGKLISKPINNNHHPTLTSRQRDILTMLQQGCHNQKIALDLGLSTKTIENHLTRIYRSLNVQSRLEAVTYLSKNPQILKTSNEAATHPPKFFPEANACGSILLVDDNPRYRYQLHRIIKNLFGHLNVQEVGSVDDAIKAVENIVFQLIIVDVILGDQDGIVCAKQIKRVSPQSRIILISAYPDKEFHRQGLAAGAAAFIDKKMLDKEVIRQIIEDTLYSADGK